MSEQEDSHGLKREIIETRNQAIKTDNQIKNLSLDVRNFEKRFDTLEGRVRLSSVGTNLLIAVALAGCSYIVTSVVTRGYEQEIVQLKDAVHDEQVASNSKHTQLEEQLASAQNVVARAQKAGAQAQSILSLLDKHRDVEAGDALDSLDQNALTPLERQLCAQRFGELRRRQALVSYRQGRIAFLQRNMPTAIQSFRRSLSLDADSTAAKAAREQLAQALWNTKRFAEAEPVVRAWLNAEPDEPTGLGRYLLATSLLRMGKPDAARAEFLQVAGRDHSRWAPAARAYLAALASGGELPEELGGGRLRVGDRIVAPPSRMAATPVAAPSVAEAAP